MAWRYWKNIPKSKLVFSKTETRSAKKRYKCCECQKIIKPGEEYSYLVFLRRYDSHHDHVLQFDTYKMCTECPRNWQEILRIFHEHGEDEAIMVGGFLQTAIKEAIDAGYLTGGEEIVKRWFKEEFQNYLANLPQEERETCERQTAFSQMKALSSPLMGLAV